MNEILGGEVGVTFPLSAESPADARLELSGLAGGIAISVAGTSGTGVVGRGSAGSIGMTKAVVRSPNKSSGGSPRTAANVRESSSRVRADRLAEKPVSDD